MALKAYLPAITELQYGFPDGHSSEAPYVQVPCTLMFENGVFLTSSPGTPVQIYGQAIIDATSTVASIKSALQGFLSSNFNLVTGRTDGNTITFVWLDDKGIL